MKAETSYGHIRRLKFIITTLKSAKPSRVLDFGCGTGAQLTYHLACSLPETLFLGVDEHVPSIKFASERFSIDNLEFHTSASLRIHGTFDVIVLSEVLEHVDQPHRLLAHLNSLLSTNGLLVLTVPNGYGPFEIVSFFHSVKKLLSCRKSVSESAINSMLKNELDIDTLGPSPHINFFSFKSLSQLLEASGFIMEACTGKSIFCGWILDSVIRRLGAESWNAKAAGILPYWVCSGWMFTFRKVREPREYQPNQRFLKSFRARLNRMAALRS